MKFLVWDPPRNRPPASTLPCFAYCNTHRIMYVQGVRAVSRFPRLMPLTNFFDCSASQQSRPDVAGPGQDRGRVSFFCGRRRRRLPCQIRVARIDENARLESATYKDVDLC